MKLRFTRQDHPNRVGNGDITVPMVTPKSAEPKIEGVKQQPKERTLFEKERNIDFSKDADRVDVYIAITTFNRPDKLDRLLSSINENIEGYSYKIVIYDDGSIKNYIENSHYRNLNDISYTRYSKNGGKSGYWKIINQTFRDAECVNFDYFFLLQDDCVVVDGFFTRAISEWEGIDDPRKMTYCTFTPTTVYSRFMWSRIKARDVYFHGKPYILGNYVDCIFMCPRSTLEALSFRMIPIEKRWETNTRRSSGVGQQITERIRRLGGTMYTAWSSLTKNDDNDSRMNPEERKINPLVSLHRSRERKSSEKVYVGMATVPWRKNDMIRAVDALYDQVDELHIFLNEYDEIPVELLRSKITVYRSQDYEDRGDAGKYFKVQNCKGYYFSCDDDLVYPADYVIRSIDAIEKYGRKYVISYHGAILKTLPLASYYKNRIQLHFKRKLENDTPVHIGGTGVMAFHTDTIKVTYEDFEEPNMADIWMGVLCQRQRVGIMCATHDFNWIKMSPYSNPTRSIYSDRSNHDRQTKVVNSLKEWKLYAV